MAFGQARRDQLARAKGYKSYFAYRQANAVERAAATRRLAKTDPTYARTGAVKSVQAYAEKQATKKKTAVPKKAVKKSRRRRVDFGGGREIVTSMYRREHMAMMRRAERNGERLYARVTFIEAEDGETYTMRLWGNGGCDPGWAIGEVEHTFGGDTIAFFADQVAKAASIPGGSAGPAGDFRIVRVDLSTMPT